ncbi:MAG: ATP-dependent 6-phosphofructokinase [Anaerolineae bacterium]|jgi:6-phosphofructokinase 1|nr:6-phosphofructokinase [Chloroflexota bacterium]
MKQIAVLTSGGDAPGMNAAIRAIVRRAVSEGLRVLGVQNGYAGLMANTMIPLGSREVSGILQRGGTMLGSARSEEFKFVEGRQRALANLAERGVDALVVIGGNGSQTGSLALAEMGFPVVGVASTIDNDLLGTDVTIGTDSAINVAVEAIDRLKVTAESHGRGFVVETMGRDSGYVALMAGIAGGAELVSIPEQELSPEQIVADLGAAFERGKRHALVVVAEGVRCRATDIASYCEQHHSQVGFSLRVTILGHVQRGSVPTAADRLLGSRLGSGAIDALLAGRSGVLVGLTNDAVSLTDIHEVGGKKKQVDAGLLSLARTMAL